MYDVAFQDYQFPPAQNGWGDLPEDGPPDPPLDGGEPNFGPLLLWETVLEDLAVFFDDMGDGISAPTGSDQHSSYDPAGDSSPFDPMFLGMFGSLPTVQNNPGYHYFDYLIADIDPEFELGAFDSTQFTANYSLGSVRFGDMGGSVVSMTLNGITVYGEWHQGNETSTGPDDLVVNGGHWHFTYTGWDPSHYEGQPPPPIPATTPGIANVENAESTAEQERQSLSTRLHQYLDEHGGHATITFDGPNGPETCQLEDLLNILDHYRIAGTNEAYLDDAGGAGRVRQLADGSYLTEVNIHQLVGYETIQGGLDFFILHEASHMLQIAQTYTHNNFQAWIANGGTRETYLGTTGYNGSSALYRSESYSNNVAAAAERLIGINPLRRPPAGYHYTGTYGGD